VDWSPDGTLLATASFDAATAVWEYRGDEWELATTLEGHDNEVKSVAFSPSGNLLATCARDKSVWIWELQVCASAASLPAGIWMMTLHLGPQTSLPSTLKP
jgi:WD40 repeat protein